jgi:hypothetical protein
MIKAIAISMSLCVGSWGIAIYQARKVPAKPVQGTMTVGEPVILTSSRAMEIEHWSCFEAFGEQTVQGTVVGCVNGAAQYE